MVIKTSNWSWARASSLPLANPAQPIRGTDLTSCPGRNRSNRRLRFSSKSIFTSAVGRDQCFHLLQDGQHLLSLYAGETIEKDLDGVTGLEMIEQALHRHSRPLEHGCSAQDFRIGMIRRFFLHDAAPPLCYALADSPAN